MTRLTTIASGSSGNCALLQSNGTNLLIDAGISMRRILAAMRLLDTQRFSAILVTHEHSDHINGLPMLLKHRAAPVYAPASVCAFLTQKCPEAAGFINAIPPGEIFQIDGIYIKPFRTPHDVPESFGYRFETEAGSLGYCTDLGHISEEVWENLKGVGMAVIECNHDTDMLKKGPYPPHLKRRILSDYGHLSNRLSAKLVLELTKNGARKIILAHLSRENNTPRLAESAVSGCLAAAGCDVDRELELRVARPDELISLCSD
jgi:phosphoribosyl 1,2-cyclic phosphodiesterase